MLFSYYKLVVTATFPVKNCQTLHCIYRKKSASCVKIVTKSVICLSTVAALSNICACRSEYIWLPASLGVSSLVYMHVACLGVLQQLP